jgi:hypothetical protein
VGEYGTDTKTKTCLVGRAGGPVRPDIRIVSVAVESPPRACSSVKAGGAYLRAQAHSRLLQSERANSHVDAVLLAEPGSRPRAWPENASSTGRLREVVARNGTCANKATTVRTRRSAAPRPAVPVCRSAGSGRRNPASGLAMILCCRAFAGPRNSFATCGRQHALCHRGR